MHADAPTRSETAPQPLPAHARDPWPGFLRAMAWIGLNSFGGPVAQLGVMHAEVVEKRKWLSDGQFVHLLNFANVLPGPEALEVAIHLGYLRRGVPGGIVAGLLFVLPGFVSLSLLAWLYVAYGRLEAVGAVLEGIRPVGMALIAASALRISAKTLSGGFAYLLCALAVGAKLFLGAPFILVLVGCGVAGVLSGTRRAPATRDRVWRRAFALGVVVAVGLHVGLDAAPPRPTGGEPASSSAAAPPAARFDTGRLVEIAWVNTKAALVTFGGAYTVLPFLREQAVTQYGWVTDAQVIDSLALAETTPGPLVSVGVFLSYLAGGFRGAVVGCVFLFLPSFLFVLGLGRYIDRVERLPRAKEFLFGVSAGTLGLIIAMSAMLLPEMITSAFGLGLALVAFVALARFRLNVIAAVAAGAVLGVGRWLALASS